jgi:predicted  nucleic acid-binding Zn-ribbon protein
MKKVDEMCEQMMKLSTRVSIIEQELGTINQTCGEFQKDMQGMSNVFDGVKEQVEKLESNIQDLTNRLNDAVSSLEKFKTQRRTERKK